MNSSEKKSVLYTTENVSVVTIIRFLSGVTNTPNCMPVLTFTQNKTFLS